MNIKYKITNLLNNKEKIKEIVNDARLGALRHHQRLGFSAYGIKDNRVHCYTPEEIKEII